MPKQTFYHLAHGCREYEYIPQPCVLGPVALTNGCFDLFHAGHVRGLRMIHGYLQAMNRNHELWVAVNSDASVRALKGPSRPIINEQDRLEVVQACKYVDHAFLFEETNVVTVLRTLEPDLWLKAGYDYETLNAKEKAAAREAGTDVVCLPRGKGRSTSNIIQDIIGRSNQTQVACTP